MAAGGAAARRALVHLVADEDEQAEQLLKSGREQDLAAGAAEALEHLLRERNLQGVSGSEVDADARYAA